MGKSTLNRKSELFDNQIPLMRPWLEEKEWEVLKDVILSGWVSQGPKVKEFEQKVAEFVGAKYAVATNACTSAIHLGLKTQNVNYGDEVIVANTTCMANVNAIKMAGANPVFVDIDERTYNIDPNKIASAITSKTKAILTIDQIGLASDLDSIKNISEQYNLAIVDDAATALGGKYKDKYLGSHGLLTTFSFHPRKMITTGEGGMLLTDNENIAEQAKILRATGASVSDLDRHKAKGIILQKYYDSGYNYRMTDIQAAIGIVQMDKLPEMLKERKRQAEYYDEAFSKMSYIITPYVPDYADHAYTSYLLKIDPEMNIDIEDVLIKMSEKKISCRYGIMPLHQEPYFDNKYTDDMFPVSCDVAKRTFFIPIYPGLKDEEMKYIVSSVQEVIEK